MKGNSELPPGAQGIGDVLSHLCKMMLHVQRRIIPVPRTISMQCQVFPFQVLQLSHL